MRYVEGLDLDRLLQQQGHLSLEEALNVVEPVAAALDAAHARDLIHRDVKPANILIEHETGHVYLTDFGVAKLGSAPGFTRTGTFLGTVHYCAPEQIEGKKVDGRTDIYSLGCVLFHCLAGQPPFPRETEVAVIHAHLTQPPPAVTTVRPELPPFLDGVVVTAMAKFPDVRYGSGHELVAALHAGEGGERPTVTTVDAPAPALAPSASAPERTTLEAPPRIAPLRPATRAKRRLLVGTGLAAALAAAVAVALVAVTRSGGDTVATPPPSPPPAAPKPKPLTSLLADRLDSRLIPLQQRLTDRVERLAATPASFRALESSAAALRRALLETQGWAGAKLVPRDKPERAVKDLFSAALRAQVSYASYIQTLSPDPNRFTRAQATATISLADEAEAAYARLAGAAANLPAMPLHRADHVHLQSVVPEPKPKPTPTRPAVPNPAPAPSQPLGVTYDFVDYSGGEGVRYRYSPRLADLVPGNGPFEGDRVPIYCYTTGDVVKGDRYWAKIASGPDRYVPATFLRYGHSGPPSGVAFCATPAPAAPSTPSPAAGIDYDFVAFSGGEGVRYRYSPRLSDLVPGNGPFEGDRVTIYCYTTGEVVKGSRYWAKIGATPDRYVPATYLRYGHSGPPAGARFC